MTFETAVLLYVITCFVGAFLLFTEVPQSAHKMVWFIIISIMQAVGGLILGAEVLSRYAS